MSAIGLVMNLLLAGLLVAALGMGWRLNRRLKALRDSHDGFAQAVRELDAAAARAEQGLADLRAATDEAVDTLADRIDKGRALSAKLERLIHEAPQSGARQPVELDPAAERRLGAMLAAAREARPERPVTREAPPRAPIARTRANFEDDLFEDEPLTLDVIPGGRR
jgi:ABC-type transporter Mla subunit MlaD